MRKILAVLIAFAALALVGASIGAAASTKSAGGSLSGQAVTTGCASPVGYCTQGEAKGDIKGTFEFQATSFTPTADTPTTSVILYTGDWLIHTRSGDLFAKDAGALSTSGGNGIAGVAVITGGTGGMAGATGQLRISGTSQSGAIEARYEGFLTLP